MTTRAKGPYRRALGLLAAFSFILLPFIEIRGQSALRFDIPTLSLHLFGARIEIDEFFGVLLFILLLSFGFIWATIMFGRLWCGWLCPQSVLVDISEDIAHPRNRRLLHIAGSFAISMLVSAAAVWYFVPPLDFIRRLLAMSLGPVEGWSWAVLSIVIWLDIAFLGRRFCATVCPYAKLQGALYDSGTMIIGFDNSRNDECMGCEACVRACPVGIDIRKGLQSECVNCAECIDACSGMLSRKQKPGLVGYHFGLPGGRLRYFRPSALIFAGVGILMLGLFVFHISRSPDIVVTVLPNYEYGLKELSDGRAAASYFIVIENHTDDAVSYAIEPSNKVISLAPAMVDVSARERRKLPVIAMFNTSVSEPEAFDIIIRRADGTVAGRERAGIISRGR